jgi:hypothetical protein
MHARRIRLWLLLLTMAVCAIAVTTPSLLAVDFYVAPDGDDANPGTKAEPFASLRQARDAVRAERADGASDTIVVEIAGGRYPLQQAVTFGPEDSGTSEHPVIYRAAKGETPVFTGGRRITGWQANPDGTWSTTIDAVKRGDWQFDELFVNATRAQPARFPDDRYLRVKQVGEDRRTSFTFYEGDIPNVADSDQLHLVFLHDWSISRVPIASIDHTNQRLTTAYNVGPSADHYKMGHYVKHPRYFLTGDRDFVDQPGEWHLNQQTGKLTYYPQDDERIEKIRAVAPVASSLLEVHGTKQQPVRNLHFAGLTLTHCRYPLPEKGYAAGQATGHENREDKADGGRVFVEAAVTFSRAKQCSFRHGRIAHVGGAGLWFADHCDDNQIIGNTIEDTGGNGLMLGTGSKSPGPVATGQLVVNNRIRRPGQRFYGAIGIWAGIVKDTRILHNEIVHTPYTGVSLGWQWNPQPTPAARNRVSYNHIHHVMQRLSDGGGIYTLGWQPDSAMRGNHIHHVPEAAGRAESNGMFLDQGTKGFRVEHNVIHDTHHAPLRFHQAHENLVRLNVLAFRREAVPKIRYNATKRAIITKRNNVLLDQAAWDGSQTKENVQEAGPKPGYLEEIGVGRGITARSDG